MAAFESIIERLGSLARVTKLSDVTYADKTFPLYSLVLGSKNPEAPSVGVFAGVHGLEKIGSEVVLSYLQTLSQLAQWDQSFLERLEKMRLVFMPIVNPVGVVFRMRSNGNGVDIMRNAPIEGIPVGGGWYRGHRISPSLPWFRGKEGAEMETETKALLQVVNEELLSSSVSLCVDVHSGFGAVDQLWFPYSHSRLPFPQLADAYALKNLFDRTYPHHFYRIEPMSRQYTIHGDPWDYIYEKHRKAHPQKLFIPLTLEMGSWAWLKKNPIQLFSKDGAFNPILPHRKQRILRRHLSFFDFLQRAVLSQDAWIKKDLSEREAAHLKALEFWYEK